MKPLDIAALTLVVSVGIFGAGCRKRNRDAAAPAVPDAAVSTDAATPSKPIAASAPVPAMSVKEQAAIQQRFMSPDSSWAGKTADQKRMAYYGWCQQFMFGDAAAKTRVLGEIRKTGLPPADLNALKEENRKLGFPPLPL